MTDQDLGKRIRRFRADAGFSQARLAERSGLSAAYLSELESGSATRPSGQVLMQLAEQLGTTIADLLGTAPPRPTTSLPSGLLEFAEQENLPRSDVEMLAGIRFRGEQPQSAIRWRMIYHSISSTKEMDEPTQSEG